VITVTDRPLQACGARVNLPESGEFNPEFSMNKRFALVRTVVGLSLAALVAAGYPVNARAGMISTQTAIEAQASPERLANLDRVRAGLARADVQERLQSLGVDPADAAARVAALPDADLARLADRMDSLPAGGDYGFLAFIGVVFLVLLLLDYLDVIHVFSHTHK
jgi:hypothetical protein